MEVLLAGLLPLILFVVIDIYQGTKKGVYAAILMSFGVVCYFVYLTGEFDWLIALEFALIVGLGALTLKLNNGVYFKLQPAVLGVVMALILLVFEVLDRPFLIEIVPHLTQFNPEIAARFKDPQVTFLLARLSHWLIYLFLGHSLVVSYAAYHWSSTWWLVSRISFYPLLIVLFFMAQVF